MKLLFLFSALVLIQPGPTPKELTQKAIEFYEKREYMEAVIHLNKAIEIDPTYAQAYFVRGNIKAEFEDYHGAMKDYNHAIEYSPKMSDAFFERGNAKMKLQDYYGAISDYTSAISFNENHIQAYFQRGRAKQFLLAYEEAIADCSKIITINPKSADAWFMRGLLRIEFGDLKNGCLDLSKAGELGDLKAYETIRERCNRKNEKGE